jgi:peptidoglycan/xylan/chitin deacetylase (PgdA/CDA1 family)
MLSLPTTSNAATSCNCVVFTLDGIRDYWLTNIQMDIIKTFDQKDADLTIGIIGNEFGTDKKMTAFIKNETAMDRKKPVIEVANNGWKYEDFTKLKIDKQSDLMNKTQARLNYLLKTQPLTFIAPYGAINKETIDALRNSNLEYTSGYLDNSKVPVYISKSKVYLIPPSINTGILDPESGLYTMISYEQLVKGIRQNITDNGVAVVSMQPMEFAQRDQADYINRSNEAEIQNLGSLLDHLKNSDISIVTIRDFAENFE